MRLDLQAVERRLRNAIAEQRDSIDPAPELDRRIMAALESREFPRRGPGLIQQLAMATVLVLIAGLVGIGITKLRANAHTTPLASPSAKPTALPSPTSVAPGATWLISAVRFTSTNEGWVIAASSADRGPRTVLRTTDGGRHWTPVLSWTGNYSMGPTGQRVLLQFVDNLHGFVLDPQSGQANGTLFRTTDGGTTWQTLSLPGGPGPGSPLTFVDPNHGWLLANVGAAMGQSPATVFQTSDGGSHWTVVAHVDYGQTSHGLSSGGDKDSLVFRDTSVGWMTSYAPTGPYIYKTVDGGHNWALQTFPVPSNLSFSWNATAFPPQFFTQRAGVFPFEVTDQGYPDTLYVYATNDGGATWNAVRRSPATTSGNAALYWQFLDATHWWVGSGARLWITSDGGVSWSTINLPLPSGSSSLALDFVDPHDGYAVVGSGITPGSMPSTTTLMKTTDGGAHWSLIPLSGLGQAISPDVCGDWSSMTSPTGSAIAQQYGEIRNCTPVGVTRSTWIITTLGLPQTHESPAQNGGVLVYRCTSSACQDGSSDHPLAGWQYHTAPYCCGVTLLGAPSPTTLLVDNGGHELTFNTVTGVYSQSG